MDFAFLKQRYDLELERRDKLTDGVNLPASFLTILGSLLAIMARDFTYEDGLLTRIFVGALVVATCVLAVGIYHLAAVLVGGRYEELPRLRWLQEQEDSIRDSCYAVGEGEHEVERAFALWLRADLVVAADRNAEANARRTTRMRSANVAVLFALLATTLAGVPYVANQWRKMHMTDTKPVSHQPVAVGEEEPKSRVPTGPWQARAAERKRRIEEILEKAGVKGQKLSVEELLDVLEPYAPRLRKWSFWRGLSD